MTWPDNQSHPVTGTIDDVRLLYRGMAQAVVNLIEDCIYEGKGVPMPESAWEVRP